MKTLFIAIIAMLALAASAMAVCTDADNGALSYQGSFVTEDGQQYSDFCLQNGNVMEFTCVEGQLMSEEMQCLIGCHTNWEGYGKCIPTAGGSAPFSIGSSSSGSSEINTESVQEDTPIHDVPEFSFVASGIALAGSITGFLVLRKKY